MSICIKDICYLSKNNGVERETIDILQGRSPKSVFARHYYKPDFLNDSKIKDCIDSLYKALIQ